MNEMNNNSMNYNQNNKPKSNIVLIIVLIIVMVLILMMGMFFAGYYLSNKSNPKSVENEEKENRDKENQESDKKLYFFDIIKECGEASNDKVCTKKVKVGDVEKEVKVYATDPYGQGGYYYTRVYIDGVKIINDKYRLEEFTILDDITIAGFYCTACGGYSSSIPEAIIAFSKDGKEVYNFNKLVFDKGYDYESYHVKNGSIYVMSTAVGLKEDMGPYLKCFLKNVNTGESYLPETEPNIVNGNNYDKYSKTIAKIEYKIDYLGNNNFSNQSKVKEYQFGELYSKEDCISEYTEYKEGYYK